MNPSQDSKSSRPSEAPEWLTTPIEFEEQRSFRVSRRTMHLLVAACAAAVLWAAIAPIRELSLARGQLVPVFADPSRSSTSRAAWSNRSWSNPAKWWRRVSP